MVIGVGTCLSFFGHHQWDASAFVFPSHRRLLVTNILGSVKLDISCWCRTFSPVDCTVGQ
jgi:hypothetical protein